MSVFYINKDIWIWNIGKLYPWCLKVNMFIFSVVDYDFKSQSVQTKDYVIHVGICCFSSKQGLGGSMS